MQPDPYAMPPGHIPPQARSAIPKVIGILMIIFGGLAVLGGLWGLVMSSMSGFGALEMGRALSMFSIYSKVSSLAGFLIGATEVFAGIALVTYRAKGIRLAVIYAVANIATTVISAILVFAWLKPMLDQYGAGALVGFGVIVGSMISVAWPVVVLALVTRPASKASCTGF